MKSIETEIWDATKPIGQQYLGQRKAVEVFDEIKDILEKELKEHFTDESGLEYINLATYFREKGALFPKGQPIVSANCGNNEGYYISVSVYDEGKYAYFMSAKTFSKKETLAILNILTQMLCLN